jgi:hypothetical protein
MATVVKRLNLTIGELVEVAGRRYEVVPDREGGVTIEPPITSAAQPHAQWGTKPTSAEDYDDDLHAAAQAHHLNPLAPR